MSTATAERTSKKAAKVIINIALGAPNEPRRQYFNAYGKEFEIERGKDIAVPRELLEVLDNCVIGMPEPDPDDQDKTIMVDRKRFPYTIVGTVEQ